MTAPVSLKEYFAAAGSVFTKSDAETIGPQLEAMAESGPIDERTIVDVARSANSPLNRYFEWRDEKAADLYRLGQANQMMRSIRVRIVEDGRPRVTSAYKLVSKAPEPKPAPRAYNVLHQDSAFAARTAVTAYDDLMAWRAKYGAYVDVWIDFAGAFRQVVNQIGEFEDAGRATGLDEQSDAALEALHAWRDRWSGVVDSWRELADQGRYLVEAIEDAEATFTRNSKTVERACMRCGTVFESRGTGNRLCPRCSASSEASVTSGRRAAVTLG